MSDPVVAYSVKEMLTRIEAKLDAQGEDIRKLERGYGGDGFDGVGVGAAAGADGAGDVVAEVLLDFAYAGVDVVDDVGDGGVPGWL
jgi:hypothetical protein